MNRPLSTPTAVTVSWWWPVLFAALAGGMGWGIRGQYGHQTGAMIAGALVCLVLVLLLCPRAASAPVARAVALGTVAMGFGGMETYGQTLGLTQNFIGDDAAWRWGMLGCAIKGSVWIGLAGVFFGLGLSGKRYTYREMMLLVLGMIAAFVIGYVAFNLGIDKENKDVPALYFSKDWEQATPEDPPRQESWGGLWAALIFMLVYTGVWKKDRLALYLGLWGILGGAIGFPLGQSLQSYHAWHPEAFTGPFWSKLDPHMNWWNWMETTFGATMGATLGLGAWLHRARIGIGAKAVSDDLPDSVQWGLIGLHAALLAASVLGWHPLYGLPFLLAFIPLVGIVGGRLFAYFLILPILLIPITAKTVIGLAYNEELAEPIIAWFFYLLVPLAIATWVAFWFVREAKARQSGGGFAWRALLLVAWLLFLLNWAYFQFPWPWAEWTTRTPNGIMFTICVVGLTGLAIFKGRMEVDELTANAGSSPRPGPRTP